MKSVRCVAVKLLNSMDKSGYSNLVLDSELKSSELADNDKRLLSRLFYGTVERKITLDYLIDSYTKGKKLDGDVRNILRIGFYQLLYMDSVPDNAAVFETVAVAKEIKKTSAGGLINAVLRGFIRNDKKIELPKDADKADMIKYSCPLWLIKKWKKEYPEHYTEIAESTLKIPDMTIAVNTTLTDTDTLLKRLEECGIECEKSKFCGSCLILKKCGRPENLREFREGLFHVQDLASQLCCEVLAPKSGETGLDVCAAPGGKTFTIAELMNNRGKVLAFDLHENRVKLIKSGAERLKLNCISAQTGNAAEFNESLVGADRILCDVPCAGLGVISKKPEIKYKKPEDLAGLPEIQYKILENAAKYLKIGGELVYSTCSLSREENDEVIERFLRENENYIKCAFISAGKEYEYKKTIFPDEFGCDGFFTAKIKRIG